jgi:hypothetical protein
VSSHEILSIVRNYDEDTKELPEPRQNFVKYTFVPGMGFYDLGLLHILGNTTNALTAAWREMLDAGMYANFPGFLYSDAGARQNTNIFRIPPGGGALIKTGGAPIQDAVMPLPYKDVGPGLMSLVDSINQTGMRVGGTAEQAVGEGKQDAPVGTTIALIDQATKILSSVHKRMHNAQAEEFALLVKCFKENPDSFWQKNRKPARKWDEETFIRAVNQVDLVPQADPNTASQTQRLMKVMALKQLQGANPAMYDPIAVDRIALQAIGWSNPEQFMVPPESLNQTPSPEQQAEQAKIQIQKQDSDTKLMLAKAKVALDGAQLHMDNAKAGLEAHKTFGQGGVVPPAEKSDHEKRVDGIDLIIKEKLADAKIAETKIKAAELAQKAQDDKVVNALKQEDIQAKERIQMIDLAQNIAVHPESDPQVHQLLGNVIPDITGGK